ncbi:hypothetical protein RJJ37_33170, partial [Rhizobium redzepovicii]|nr:hypothetical protein [Rhizobium redzepovicii]
RLCIHALRFQEEHLNSMSMKPAAGQHTITVEAVEDGNPSIEYPRFIDGERGASPEVGLTGLVTILTTPSSICRRRGRAENSALSVIDVAEAVRQTAIEIIAAALLGKMRN